jgi:hypothetical protein
MSYITLNVERGTRNRSILIFPACYTLRTLTEIEGAKPELEICGI